MANKQDFVIQQGKTFSQVLRWEAPPILYKPITGISQSAPMVVTSVGHGIPAGWRAAIVSVRGMTEVNAKNNPPRVTEYRPVTVVDADHISINDVNSSDFSAWTSGGYIQLNSPVDLAGFAARMSVKDKIGGLELLRLDTTNNRIVLDNINKTITLTVSATDTAALTFIKGVYDLELVSGSGVVTALLTGGVSVTKEVTTT